MEATRTQLLNNAVGAMQINDLRPTPLKVMGKKSWW
jgi:hypothetical protein